jgi:hypothetical protein
MTGAVGLSYKSHTKEKTAAASVLQTKWQAYQRIFNTKEAKVTNEGRSRFY